MLSRPSQVFEAGDSRGYKRFTATHIALLFIISYVNPIIAHLVRRTFHRLFCLFFLLFVQAPYRITRVSSPVGVVIRAINNLPWYNDSCMIAYHPFLFMIFGKLQLKIHLRLYSGIFPNKYVKKKAPKKYKTKELISYVLLF
jgi:hypothetical protein